MQKKYIHVNEDFVIMSIYSKPELFASFASECKKQKVFLDQISLTGSELFNLSKVAPCYKFAKLIDLKKLLKYAKAHPEFMNILKDYVLESFVTSLSNQIVQAVAKEKIANDPLSFAVNQTCAYWQEIIWYFFSNVSDADLAKAKKYMEEKMNVHLYRLNNSKKTRNNTSVINEINKISLYAISNVSIFLVGIAETSSTALLPKNNISYLEQVKNRIAAGGRAVVDAVDIYASQLLRAFHFLVPADYRISFTSGIQLETVEDIYNYWRCENPDFRIAQKDLTNKEYIKGKSRKQSEFLQYSGAATAGLEQVVEKMKDKNSECLTTREFVDFEVAIHTELGYYAMIYGEQGIDFFYLVEHSGLIKTDALIITQNAFMKFKLMHGRYPKATSDDMKLFAPLLANFAAMYLISMNANFFPVDVFSKNIQENENKKSSNIDNKYKKEAIKLAKENEVLKKLNHKAKADTAKSVETATQKAKREVKELRNTIAIKNAKAKEIETSLQNELLKEREKNEKLEAEISRIKLALKLKESDRNPKDEVEEWLKNHQIIVYGGRMEFPSKVSESTKYAENILFADPREEFKTGWLKNCDGVIFKIDFAGHSSFHNARRKVESANVPYVFNENGSTNVDRFYEDVLLLKEEISKNGKEIV